MGRQSKATKARRSNLGRLKNPQNPSVEDASDDEDLNFEDDDLPEHGFFFPDDESPSEEGSDASDSDEDEELHEDELDGLINDSEAKIEHFNAILFEAQAMAVKAEREANGEKPKRKQHYTGNSTRTQQYRAQKRRQLAATGQKFINSWFSKEKKPSELLPKDAAPVTAEIDEISDDSDTSEDEESKHEDEIDACVHRLFPGTAPVSFLT